MRFNKQGHNIIHRGLANKTFKENSIKAFKFCFKKNYGIETDLHTTLDNKINLVFTSSFVSPSSSTFCGGDVNLRFLISFELI